MLKVSNILKLDDLIALVIEVLVKRANTDINISVPFIEIFMEACINQKETENGIIQANPGMRYQIRESLIKNNYVIADPEDVEAVFITQKAIDKVLLLVKENTYSG
jgi:hypothetical protein